MTNNCVCITKTLVKRVKLIVLSNIMNVVSDNILHYMYLGTPLGIKKCIVLLHTLSAYNSLLVHYKVYSSDPRNVCIHAEGMLKPMKT